MAYLPCYHRCVTSLEHVWFGVLPKTLKTMSNTHMGESLPSHSMSNICALKHRSPSNQTITKHDLHPIYPSHILTISMPSEGARMMTWRWWSRRVLTIWLVVRGNCCLHEYISFIQQKKLKKWDGMHYGGHIFIVDSLAKLLSKTHN